MTCEKCPDCETRQMNLFECSPEYAHQLILWAAVICALYFIITFRVFIPSYRASKTKRGRWVWGSMAAIFPFCAITGYSTVILSGWHPDPAYNLKVWFMKFDAIACVAFLLFMKGHKLEIDRDQDIEEALDNENDSPLERIKKAKRILNQEVDE